MDTLFWKNKRVFLTGHTGFKGSWLSLWLQHLGAEVCGYSLLPSSQPSLFQLADVAQDMRSVTGDIRDLSNLKSVMLDFQPDILIHMAAQSLVRLSYKDPVETYSTNVMGTVNTLEAARYCDSLKVILNVTSDKCYQNNAWCWGYRESDRLGGKDPYSNSKACAELVTAAYQHSFFSGSQSNAALATARAGNVIGGGDWAEDRIVPDTIQSILAGKNVSIRHPNAVRPWQYVLEPLSGYLALVEAMWENPAEYSGAWNFGPREQDCKPVLWLVEQIIALWGSPIKIEKDTGLQPHEAMFLKLDISKAKAQLNWVPRWDLHQSLENLVHWYQAWRNNTPLRDISLSQITHFQNKN
jgi:CDP-glucose 4,6-dehydratase